MSNTRPRQLFPNLPRAPWVIELNKEGKGVWHPLWELYFQQLSQVLQNTFSPDGFTMPPQPTSNIVLLTDNAYTGNILYDSTNNTFKGNEGGVWKTFTLT